MNAPLIAPFIKKALLLAVVSLGLGSCTIAVRPAAVISVSQANIIQNFQPTRGEGSSYRVGEEISFNFSSRTAGYLTLVSLDPDGYGNVLASNLFVPAGRTVLPRGSDAVFLTLAPPRGLQRVRAIFTASRPRNTIVFSGTYNRNGWNTYTESYLRPYGASERDIYETYFFIR